MSTSNTLVSGQPSDTTERTKNKATDVAEQAKTMAADTAETAVNTAKSKANEAKSSLADEVSGISSALRIAANEMRSGSPQERTFGQIAEGLADASDAMRDKDLSEMVQSANAFARKNPMVFLAGATLVGFAASRFAKASSPTPARTITHAPSPAPTNEPSAPYAKPAGDLS